MSSYSTIRRLFEKRIHSLVIGMLLTIFVLLYAAIPPYKNDKNRVIHRSDPLIMKNSSQNDSVMQFIVGDSAGFFTFLLVIVGIVQAALFVWQLRLFRKGLIDGRIAAEAAKKSADSVVSAERPYLLIADACFGINRDPNGRQVDPPEGLVVCFFIKNHGKGLSFINEVITKTAVAKNIPVFNRIGADIKKTSILRVAAGECIEYVAQTNITSDEWRDATSAQNELNLFLYGLISYDDQFGCTREVGFAYSYAGWDKAGRLALSPCGDRSYWSYS